MTKERALAILRQYLAQAESEEAWLAEHDMPDENIRSASEDAEALRMAIAAWEEQEWVPVTEGMPEKGQKVLLWMRKQLYPWEGPNYPYDMGTYNPDISQPFWGAGDCLDAAAEAV